MKTICSTCYKKSTKNSLVSFHGSLIIGCSKTCLKKAMKKELHQGLLIMILFILFLVFEIILHT